VIAIERGVLGALGTGNRLLGEDDIEDGLRVEGCARVAKSSYSTVYIYVKKPNLRKMLNVSIC
jgi:hypothetical protein